LQNSDFVFNIIFLFFLFKIKLIIFLQL